MLVLEFNDYRRSERFSSPDAAVAVSLLTERDWRPLPLELVLGKTSNCTWGVGLAPHTLKIAGNETVNNPESASWEYPHRCCPV